MEGSGETVRRELERAMERIMWGGGKGGFISLGSECRASRSNFPGWQCVNAAGPGGRRPPGERLAALLHTPLQETPNVKKKNAKQTMFPMVTSVR